MRWWSGHLLQLFSPRHVSPWLGGVVSLGFKREKEFEVAFQIFAGRFGAGFHRWPASLRKA